MTHLISKTSIITISTLTLLITISSFSIAIAQEPQETTSTQQAPVAQAIGGIPTKYNTMFSVEWSGGSLYQLKAQLATQGCILNDIIVTEDETTYAYNQYETPSTDQNKQAFLKKYEHFIPAGTLQASCYNICEFRFVDDEDATEQECLSANDLAETLIGFDDESESSELVVFLDLFLSLEDIVSSECSDNSALYRKEVARLLPVLGDVCVASVDYEDTQIYGAALLLFQHDLNLFKDLSLIPDGDDDDIEKIAQKQGLKHLQKCFEEYDSLNKCFAQGALSTNIQSIVVLNQLGEEYDITQRVRNIHHFHTEVHEMCHINQYWQGLQSLEQDKLIIGGRGYLDNIPSIQELIEIVGFQESWGDSYRLPAGSVYQDLYGNDDPIELGAELCNLYLLDKIGHDSFYRYGTYSERYFSGSFLKYNPDFEVGVYLTPRIRQWVEKYVLGTRAEIDAQETTTESVNVITQRIDTAKQHLSDWEYNYSEGASYDYNYNYSSGGGLDRHTFFQGENHVFTITTNVQEQQQSVDTDTIRTGDDEDENQQDEFMVSSLYVVDIDEEIPTNLNADSEALKVLQSMYNFTDQDIGLILQTINTSAQRQEQDNYYSLSTNQLINGYAVAVIVNGYDSYHSWGSVPVDRMDRSVRVIVADPLESVEPWVERVKNGLVSRTSSWTFNDVGDSYRYNEHQESGRTYHNFSISQDQVVLYTISLREDNNPARIAPFDEATILFEAPYYADVSTVQEHLETILGELTRAGVAIIDYDITSTSIFDIWDSVPIEDGQSFTSVTQGNGSSVVNSSIFTSVQLLVENWSASNNTVGSVVLSTEPVVVERKQDVAQRISNVQNSHPQWEYEQHEQIGQPYSVFYSSHTFSIPTHKIHARSNTINITESSHPSMYTDIEKVQVALYPDLTSQDQRNNMLSAVREILQVTDQDMYPIAQQLSDFANSTVQGKKTVEMVINDCIDVQMMYEILGVRKYVSIHFTPNQRCFNTTVREFALARKNYFLDLHKDQYQGNVAEDRSIAIIEYANLECPACREMHSTLETLYQEYGGEVLWVYRHFDLGGGYLSDGRAVAEASECVVGAKGDTVFFKYLHELAQPETSLDRQNLIDVAVDLGVDKQAFIECLESGRTADRVDEETQQGDMLGVMYIPTIFIVEYRFAGEDLQVISHHKVDGALYLDAIKQKIDAAIEQVPELQQRIERSRSLQEHLRRMQQTYLSDDWEFVGHCLERFTIHYYEQDNTEEEKRGTDRECTLHSTTTDLRLVLYASINESHLSGFDVRFSIDSLEALEEVMPQLTEALNAVSGTFELEQDFVDQVIEKISLLTTNYDENQAGQFYRR